MSVDFHGSPLEPGSLLVFKYLSLAPELSIMSAEKSVPVKKYPIKLGQFLKLADYVTDGFQAKQLIAEGFVSINGVRVFERGKQLNRGDLVSCQESVYRCT